MNNTELKTVTLTKLCKLHGISMPKECVLTEQQIESILSGGRL